MRFVRFVRHDESREQLGRLEGSMIVAAESAAGGLLPTPQLWEAVAEWSGPGIPLGDVHLLPPVAPSKIVCVGLNYADHAAEGGNELPETPLLFSKWPSSIVGPHDEIRLPSQESDPDFEAELAVVVGRRSRQLVDEEQGWASVGGYTVINDVSGRQAQMGDGQWARGKGYDTFAPIGPCVVYPSEIDPGSLALGCSLDGDVFQSSSTSEMVFNVGQLLSYISWHCTLEPGDVIATGTPAGIGFMRTPRVRLEPGQLLETWVEGIGRLENRIVADPSGPWNLDAILGQRSVGVRI